MLLLVVLSGAAWKCVQEICSPLVGVLVTMQLDTGILIANYKQARLLAHPCHLTRMVYHLDCTTPAGALPSHALNLLVTPQHAHWQPQLMRQREAKMSSWKGIRHLKPSM